jgi:hypothetical protein
MTYLMCIYKYLKLGYMIKTKVLIVSFTKSDAWHMDVSFIRTPNNELYSQVIVLILVHVKGLQIRTLDLFVFESSTSAWISSSTMSNTSLTSVWVQPRSTASPCPESRGARHYSWLEAPIRLSRQAITIHHRLIQISHRSPLFIYRGFRTGIRSNAFEFQGLNQTGEFHDSKMWVFYLISLPLMLGMVAYLISLS